MCRFRVGLDSCVYESLDGSQSINFNPSRISKFQDQISKTKTPKKRKIGREHSLSSDLKERSTLGFAIANLKVTDDIISNMMSFSSA
jgi:hypothetical protein